MKARHAVRMQRAIGIDEAGYGPILGPLVIGCCTIDCDDEQADIEAVCRAAPLGVRDSKQLHKPGDLGPLESVALAAIEWLAGIQPQNAAELFALFGEDEQTRSAFPWMAGATELSLPRAARNIPNWDLPTLTSAGASARIIHPHTLNEAATAGTNRAAVELDAIGELLRERLPGKACSITVDRLGGRRFYADFFADLSPDSDVTDIDEIKAASRYVFHAHGHQHRAAFLVGGESASPLVAIASCIAKYLREVHMLLLNQYWSGRFRWLKPCAGYGSDAKRWLYQLGSGNLGAYGPELVRNYEKFAETT